jgi:hypothetical protein
MEIIDSDIKLIILSLRKGWSLPQQTRSMWLGWTPARWICVNLLSSRVVETTIWNSLLSATRMLCTFGAILCCCLCARDKSYCCIVSTHSSGQSHRLHSEKLQFSCCFWRRISESICRRNSSEYCIPGCITCAENEKPDLVPTLTKI